MATSNKGRKQNSSPKISITRSQTPKGWHYEGSLWLLGGWFGVALFAGLVSLLLFERPALRESLGIIVTVLLILLSLGILDDTKQAIQRLSHFAGDNTFFKAGLSGLLIIGCGLWIAWLLRPVNFLCNIWLGECRFSIEVFENRLPTTATFDPDWAKSLRDTVGKKLNQIKELQYICEDCVTTPLKPHFKVAGQFIAEMPASVRMQIYDSDGVYFEPDLPVTGEGSLSSNEILVLSNRVTFAILDHLGIPLTNGLRYEILQTPTDSPMAMEANNDGIQMYQRKLDREAIAKFQEALQHDPNYSTAHANLAAALERQGYYEGAIQHYLEAIQALPNYAIYPYNLGVLYSHLGQYDEAIGELKQAIHLDSKFVEAYNELGNIYIERRQWSQANSILRQGYELQPEFAPLSKNLGRSNLALGKSADSISNLQTALQIETVYLLDKKTSVAWNSTDVLTITNQLATIYHTVGFATNPNYAVLLRLDGTQEAIKLLLDAYIIEKDFTNACIYAEAYTILDPQQVSQWAPNVADQVSQLNCP